MKWDRDYWLGAALAICCSGCALDAPMYGGADKSPSVIEFALYAGLFLGLFFALGVAVGKRD